MAQWAKKPAAAAWVAVAGRLNAQPVQWVQGSTVAKVWLRCTPWPGNFHILQVLL